MFSKFGKKLFPMSVFTFNLTVVWILSLAFPSSIVASRTPVYNPSGQHWSPRNISIKPSPPETTKVTDDLPHYVYPSYGHQVHTVTTSPSKSKSSWRYHHQSKNRTSHHRQPHQAIYTPFTGHRSDRVSGGGGDNVNSFSIANANTNFEQNSQGTRQDSYLPTHHQNSYDEVGYYGEHEHATHPDEEESEYDEEGAHLLSKTLAATKLLKVGKSVFVFFMVLVVILLAVISHFGAITLSPTALPLALLPLGLIALLLFIPLFLLYIPLVASGIAVAPDHKGHHRSGRHVKIKRGRDRTIIEDLIENFGPQIETFLMNLSEGEWS